MCCAPVAVHTVEQPWWARVEIASGKVYWFGSQMAAEALMAADGLSGEMQEVVQRLVFSRAMAEQT